MCRLTTTALVGVIAFATACTSAPLLLPGPILATKDVTARRAAVLRGMAARGWVVEDEVDHRILARLYRREHVAKLWVDYSQERIEFRYGGSEALDCVQEGESCRSIHRNYNKWARNLALDISREVTKQRVLE